MLRIFKQSRAVLLVTLAMGSVAWAGDPSGVNHVDQSATRPESTAPTTQSRMVPRVDYGGDLRQRPAMTGDWSGTRQQLMDNGLRFDLRWTQILQRNTAGGKDISTAYQGGLNLGVQLDTGAAGLWPGGILKVRGEGRYGESSNGDTGAVMPVNTNSLYPIPGEDTFQLAELNYTQFLSSSLGLTIGKFSPRETNVFSGNETEQFQNLAFNIDPVYGTTVPQAFLGVGVIFVPHPNVAVTTLVLDSEGQADESGFDTAFKDGSSLFQLAEVKIDPFNLPGHQRLGWTWSNKTRTKLGQLDAGLVKDWIRFRLGLGPQPNLETGSDDWSVFYDFDQYLYVVPGSKDRGFGLFGRFGVSSGEFNPIGEFYSLGVGGKGMLPSRGQDSFGLGYYYLSLSDKVGPVARVSLEDGEQGVEAYYNVAVTPWLSITPSVQAIKPVTRDTDWAWLAGLRLTIEF